MKQFKQEYNYQGFYRHGKQHPGLTDIADILVKLKNIYQHVNKYDFSFAKYWHLPKL